MAQEISFWKGVSAGFLAGMAVAAALRYSPFEKFITNLSTLDGKIDRNLQKLEQKLDPEGNRTPSISQFTSRHEQPESVGDPEIPASARTGAMTSLFPPQGSPGGRTAAEIIETAGYPGERIDHIDISRPLWPYPRSLDLGSAG